MAVSDHSYAALKLQRVPRLASSDVADHLSSHDKGTQDYTNLARAHPRIWENCILSPLFVELGLICSCKLRMSGRRNLLILRHTIGMQSQSSLTASVLKRHVYLGILLPQQCRRDRFLHASIPVRSDVLGARLGGSPSVRNPTTPIIAVLRFVDIYRH
jgi:hypothetical protein